MLVRENPIASRQQVRGTSEILPRDENAACAPSKQPICRVLMGKTGFQYFKSSELMF